MDLAARLAIGGDREPLPPLGCRRRIQPKICLGGIDLQHLPPEQPHQPVGPALQGAVVHRRLQLAQIVDQQVPDPAGWDAVPVDQGLDRVLAGVAFGRPRRAQRGRFSREGAESNQQLPGQVLATVATRRADDVGVMQQMLAFQFL
ncbi:hypothetical protein AB0E63_33130 [Kribbella sp. NPDC026596]|uniref:hypothetical protein n=1 Tax=Kribbella sp. NPDC026596 TaxID=3155122 RepID=UPI0033F47D99